MNRSFLPMLRRGSVCALLLLGLGFSSLQSQSPAEPAAKTPAPRAPEPVRPVNPNMFKKFLAVDLSAQKVDLYENGAIVYSTPASSGREEKPTANGVYKITSKHEKWTSTIYGVPMPHFLRLNGSDTGLHAGILPGYPGSAGCIRLPEDAAAYLFSQVPVGTPVLIQGTAPDIEWIKAQYRKRAKNSAYSSANKSAMKQNWKAPYPVVQTSWSQTETDPKKTP